MSFNHTSFLFHFLVNYHVIVIYRLLDNIIYLTFTLRQMTWDWCLRWLGEHLSHRHLKIVSIISLLLFLILLKCTFYWDFLPCFVSLDPFRTRLEEMNGLATLLCNDKNNHWISLTSLYLHDRYGIDFSSSSQNLEMAMLSFLRVSAVTDILYSFACFNTS